MKNKRRTQRLGHEDPKKWQKKAKSIDYHKERKKAYA